VTLFVVADQRAGDRAQVVGLEADAVAYREFEHGAVCPHLVEEAQALDHAAVEVCSKTFVLGMPGRTPGNTGACLQMAFIFLVLKTAFP
jgi:hypothetical protein